MLRGESNTPILYACAKHQEQYFLVGSDLQGNTLSQTPLPSRGHGITIDQAHQQAVVFARRPDNYFIQFSPSTGEAINQYQIEAGKHFFGHGVFDQQGLLYVTEGDSESSQTRIGIYQLGKQIKKVGQLINDFGLGGHEIVMHPDDQHLILALGGIKTSGREKLNIDSMQPALLYIDKKTGQITQKISIDDHQLSIRHLGVNTKGIVAFACQYQGDEDIPSLIYRHQLGEKQATPLVASEETWLRFDDYIGSVAIDETKIVATSPRGGCFATWSIEDNKMHHIQPLNEVCGTLLYQNQETVSTGNGELNVTGKSRQTQWHWDNHMAIWLG
ncbi:DUF1513 domain-containing protein [Psychromonas sp. KJ10-10]|uniref:DUF1513 domain-containing protein n=1 Tax=Psychromonas sp. KJ10-10 TaxID=3391823 RepID=UPI0039B514C3